MKVFVTGATGFVGQHFVTRLLEKLQPNDTVYALTRSPFSSSDSRVVPVSGDLQNLNAVSAKILECDYVFHLGAYALFFGTDLPSFTTKPV